VSDFQVGVLNQLWRIQAPPISLSPEETFAFFFTTHFVLSPPSPAAPFRPFRTQGFSPCRFSSFFFFFFPPGELFPFFPLPTKGPEEGVFWFFPCEQFLAPESTFRFFSPHKKPCCIFPSFFWFPPRKWLCFQAISRFDPFFPPEVGEGPRRVVFFFLLHCTTSCRRDCFFLFHVCSLGKSRGSAGYDSFPFHPFFWVVQSLC